MEISGRAFTVWYYVAIWYYVELGGLWWTNVRNSALPPQRHRPDTLLKHQNPVSHTQRVLLRALLSNILIACGTTLLSNWELRWMGFLPSPDGWRLQFLLLETPPPHFFYYFCKKSIKRVGAEVRFVIGKALDTLLLHLLLSLWLVPIQQQIEAGDDSPFQLSYDYVSFYPSK